MPTLNETPDVKLPVPVRWLKDPFGRERFGVATEWIPSDYVRVTTAIGVLELRRDEVEAMEETPPMTDDIYSGWGQPQEPVVRHARIGERFRCDSFVTIGTVPFSFDRSKTPYVRRPVAAGVVIGDDVEVMSHTNIDRGTERDTTIGSGTKIDRLVHVAHDALIGKNCILVAGTIVGGFAELGDEVYVGMNVSIKSRVKIGAGAQLGAGAVVLKDVPAGEVWVGNPARFLRKKGQVGRARDAAWYDAEWTKAEWLGKPASEAPWAPLWNAVLEHVARADWVLDLGCGCGHLAELRAARDDPAGWWFGVDFSAAAINAAKAKNIRGSCFDVQPMGPFLEGMSGKWGPVNVVVLTEVLEHISHDLPVLAQIPAGKRVVFTLPDHDSEGHVRWFNSTLEVRRRYGALFTDLVVDTLVIGQRTYFIVHGHRSATGPSEEA